MALETHETMGTYRRYVPFFWDAVGDGVPSSVQIRILVGDRGSGMSRWETWFRKHLIIHT